MSTSPTKRYYDSRPSSRATSPQNAAEVRSAAVAKLKRAASLPRRTDTRRPSQPTSARPEINLDPEPDQSHSTPRREAEHAEEVLSPSPTTQGFDHHAYIQNDSMQMQRSASAASSFHLPTPPHLAGYSQATTPTISHSGVTSPVTDWSAMQLAQSYLPSLSPVAIGHSPYMAPIPTTHGRNTPSPLPTLGELRTLQRSNSAAARAKAMDKLTGGRETPVNDESSLDQTPTKPGLQRADSLGAPRMLGGSASKASTSRADHPPSAFVDPKPRLQRSFTVSSSNMGEERRSAVGRRMVARLGERRAAKDTEEDDVRRLWEERRGMADQPGEDIEEQAVGENAEGIDDPSVSDTDGAQSEERHRPAIPDLIRHSPTNQTHAARENQYSGDSLGVPDGDRPFSRTTQISEGDAFEYESHLRRSLSSRTARGAVGTVIEPVPSRQVSRQDHHVEHLSQFEDEDEVEEDEEAEADMSNGIHQRLYQPVDGVPVNDFTPPNPPFITPSRHAQRGSTSTDETQSPGGDSTMSGDGLQSMLFVMGAGPGTNTMKRETGGFPMDVDEGATSSWGTPAKDLSRYNHHAASSLDNSPSLNHTTPSAFEDTLTPPELSARSSVMSWEELGGEADREIPSDFHYHKKSGSISSKVGRAVKGAMRKRSQSRSSGGSINTPPTSPKSIGEALTVAVQNFNRRGSQSSVSPSQSSIARSFARGSPMAQQGEFVRHQPSVSSLAPSVLNESSANGLLLQHQLSNDPQPILDIPRAKIDDPRVFNSKLSPFPGVEPGKLGDSLDLPDLPRLMHQNSDSAVPSQQRVTPQVADSIHSLPLPVHSDHTRRGSDDSIGRKGWLAKAFGSTTSPRSSAGTSRKSSMTDFSPSGNRLSPEKHATFAEAVEIDPFAAPPPPAIGNRSRAISPSVSTVAEGNEENRTTQFTVHRSATHTPVYPDIEEEGGREGPSNAILQEKAKMELPSKSLEVLARMDQILAMAPEDPNRPEILDDPPRKLLLATQVLQVVNMNLVKDRYLLLFNDILVICKPVIEAGPIANLDLRFIVKSIVSLDRLHASGFKDDASRYQSVERDAILRDFMEQFASDPFTACTDLIERKHWRDGMMSLANVIIGMPELDKAQLGIVLSKEQDLLAAYIDSLNLNSVAIDDALRIFLLSAQLPLHSDDAERILYGFAQRYHETNKNTIPYDVERAHSLITGMMMLNDSLHGSTFGFAMLNPGLTVSVWVAAFGERDPERTVKPDLLQSIYTSIQRAPLQGPLPPERNHTARAAQMTPERLPNRLTVNTWSEPITITLPAPDPDLRIKLLGDGLEVEPASLDFAHSTKATFRVRGTEAGNKTLLLSRLGKNAPLYSNLPTAKIIQVERALMKHTFHLSFANHLGIPRRYCFSLPNPELRTKWGVLLPRQISIIRQKKNVPISTLQQKIRSAAEAVSLVVLRDALIPPPEVENGKVKMERTGSFSIAYAVKEGGTSPIIGKTEQKSGDKKTHGLMQDTTGKEVVLVCRQNSLLPGMLELLQAGVEPKERGARF